MSSPSIEILLEKSLHVSKEGVERIKEAFEYAKEAHKGQVRKSGDPYFYHVYEVGLILAELGMGSKIIAAGLLHDVIEDTTVTEAQINEKFGDEILQLIKGVTKLGTVKYRGIDRHVESLRKFFVASSKDVRVIIIKLADRLHNIRTLQYVREDKQKRIALETIEIHSQLAYRLGMGSLTGELQDGAFKYAFPKEFEMVDELLKQKSHIDAKYIDTVKKSLHKLLAKHEIDTISVASRIKHKYSLWRKLKKYDMDIDKIYDIIALRVIVSSVEDCYRVLGVIHSTWRPLPGRVKDYIASPKPNGYQSLHTTIFTGNGGIVEIQIRTKEMNLEAQYGIASHLAYKSESGQKKAMDKKKLTWIQDLYEAAEKGESSSQYIRRLKTDHFNDRIFIFTPKGDVIDLPQNSSVIDFAYAVHSDVGNHARSSKVNGKHGTIKAKLENGDICEVVTNDNAHPTLKWLDYAKTTNARKHIRSHVERQGLISSFIGRFKS